MITILYTQTFLRNSLILSGHADYAEHGSDIVCSAVSAITATLAGYLANHNGGEGSVADLNSGDSYVSTQRDAKTDVAFDMAVIGLMQIADKYPDNVQVYITAIGGDMWE